MLAHLVGDAAEAWGLLALLAFCQSRVGARRDGAATTCRCSPRTRRSGTASCSASAKRHCTAPRRSARPARSSSKRRSSRRTRSAGLGASVPDAAIVALYDALVAMRPTIGAIVSRACAVGAASGAAAGRAALAALPAEDVDGYQPYWAALAHLAAAEGEVATARAARERAVGLSTDPAVRRFSCARPNDADGRATAPRPYWRPSARIDRSPPPCASSSA
jgi:RNA polymerase sigma-70 factor (ECF subfamily)